MSATNTTPNIGLPSFIGTDKPAWLTDWNGAMNTIDSEVGTAKTDIQGNTTAISGLSASVTSLNGTVGQHTTSIQTLTTATTHNAGDINTINSLIGNGTPTTTDHTLIGAINELHADQGDLANLTTTDKSSLVAAVNEVAQGGGGTPSAQNVSYDNTSSGLTANNVQAAIDEIVAGGGTGYDFDITAHMGDATLTMASGFSALDPGQAGIKYAMNADYSIGKIYHSIIVAGVVPSTWTKVASIAIPNMPAIQNSYYIELGTTISMAGGTPYATDARLKFNTDGSIDIECISGSGSASVYAMVDLPACLYFFKDFGD